MHQARRGHVPRAAPPAPPPAAPLRSSRQLHPGPSSCPCPALQAGCPWEGAAGGVSGVPARCALPPLAALGAAGEEAAYAAARAAAAAALDEAQHRALWARYGLH